MGGFSKKRLNVLHGSLGMDGTPSIMKFFELLLSSHMSFSVKLSHKFHFIKKIPLVFEMVE